MRAETSGQRQSIRLRWWREVLEGAERANAPTWDQLLDETVRLRFHVAPASVTHREAEATFPVGRGPVALA